MEPVSFVLGLAPRNVKSHIDYFRHDDALKKDLINRADDLIRRYHQSVDEGPRRLHDIILKDLKLVEQSLQSVRTSQPGSRWFDRFISFIKATHNHKELQDCEIKLARLINQVKRIHDRPTTYTYTAERPISDAGLNRALCVLDFLQTSASQDLRVVCIHGLPGLGKTTLLYEVWNAVLKEAPFLARAFVRIGHEVTNDKICSLQNKILRQLDRPNKEFLTIDFGKAELRKCFEQLKKEAKPLLLAIDNVFSPGDLESLLPNASLMSLLPVKSCILLTCRDYRVVKSLLINCSLQEDDKQQVLCYNPPLLSDEEATRVFVSCARMQQDDLCENQELLGALVPKCKGLPLALTVLGNTFKDTSMRATGKWQEIEKQMMTLEDDEDFTSPITAALQISYKTFNKSLQEAFLNIVKVFYGWPWEVVECIVGELSMKHLEDSSLISPKRSVEECNRGAISESFMRYFEENSLVWSSHVWMHDVVLTFGKKVLRNNGSTVRSLTLTADDPDAELQSHLAGARNLQIIAVTPSTGHGFEVSYCEKAVPSQQSEGKPKFLMLGGLDNLANSIIQTMVADGIRAMHLKECDAIHWLPDTIPLKELQALQIERCNAFHGFSNACVQGWHNLKRLIIMRCPELTTIPDALASLQCLELVHIDDCPRLQEFPPLTSPNGPFQLVLCSCPVLEWMGDVSCRLQTMRLESCTLLQELPCFHFPCLETLTTLTLSFLPQLQQLPGSICSMKALRKLRVQRCESLVDMPHNLGHLACLEKFSLCGCKKLQQLPASICSLKALRELELRGCESLTDLPHNVGDLACLEKFSLCGCEKLQQLPASICSLKALRELDLAGCDSLVELPHNVGDLACLEKFSLWECKKLQQLPASFGSMKALGELELGGCGSLLDLPHNIGDLASLKKLRLGGCKKLQQIPGSVCRMKALEELDLRGCESLANVPHNIGDLPRLTVKLPSHLSPIGG